MKNQEVLLGNYEENKKVQDGKIKELTSKMQAQDEKIKAQTKSMQVLEKKIADHMNAQISKKEDQKMTVDNFPTSSSYIFSDTYTWKINQLQKKIEKAKNDYCRDEPLIRSFYTSRGHKLNIELCLNGDEDSWNEDVAIFFKTEEGIFDDVVKWPM